MDTQKTSFKSVLSYLLFALTLGAWPLELLAQTQHVVLVHGVGGNDKTFGSMGEALQERARRRDQSLKHYKFVYETSNPKLDSDDFAIQLGQFLKDRVLPELKSDQDRISFVCHSQGGLVTSIWYFHSFMQHRGLRQDHRYIGPDARLNTNYFPEIIPYVDSLVTIGTPFWGSRLATFLIDDGLKNSAARALGQDFMQAMGQKQLEEMALGSRTIMNFRKNVAAMPYMVLSDITQNLRALNIAGVANMQNLQMQAQRSDSWKAWLFTKTPLSEGHFETDLAVPVTSARFDSFYSIRNNTDYLTEEVSGVGFTNRTKFAPLLIVNAVHASPFPDTVYDMAYVPQECIPQACDHATLHYVYHHLYGKTISGFAPGVDQTNFHNYITSFRVNFPEGVNASEQDLKIEFLGVRENIEYEVSFGRGWEIDHFKYFDPRRLNSYFMAVQGQIEPKIPLLKQDLDRPVTAKFRFSAPGYRPRVVETKIQATYTTYVEVSLGSER